MWQQITGNRQNRFNNNFFLGGYIDVLMVGTKWDFFLRNEIRMVQFGRLRVRVKKVGRKILLGRIMTSRLLMKKTSYEGKLDWLAYEKFACCLHTVEGPECHDENCQCILLTLKRRRVIENFQTVIQCMKQLQETQKWFPGYFFFCQLVISQSHFR